jgi:molybdopterin converting factor small subunit
MMQVTVGFFSFYRHITQMDQLSIDLPEGAALAELLNVLNRRFACLTFTHEQGLMMVNRKNASSETVLKEGDHILLLPMLEGG